MPRHVLPFLTLVALTGAAPATAQPPRLVVLVRHAEAGGEPERNPPLTAAGRERAEALATTLADAGIGTIVVTGLARTQETAAPLAAARGITPTMVEVAGGLARHVEAVAAAVHAAPPGHAVLVVGHSNTIPAIVTALGGPPLDDLCHTEFDTLFVVELRPDTGPRIIRGRYGAPDAEPCPSG